MASGYPPPLIIQPRALPHKQTFILLHGRGSSGDKFGPVLLDTPILTAPVSSADGGGTNPPDDQTTSSPPTVQTLATTFPHARFVFPTAARRRATVYNRARTHRTSNSRSFFTFTGLHGSLRLQGPAEPLCCATPDAPAR
jgi:predicted esterase